MTFESLLLVTFLGAAVTIQQISVVTFFCPEKEGSES